MVVLQKKKKQIRLTESRVMTSEEGIKMIQEKEDAKKQALKKDKQKEGIIWSENG